MAKKSFSVINDLFTSTPSVSSPTPAPAPAARAGAKPGRKPVQLSRTLRSVKVVDDLWDELQVYLRMHDLSFTEWLDSQIHATLARNADEIADYKSKYE